MIKHSDPYRKLVSEGLEPGRWLSVVAAEHFSGLPMNWTSPAPGSVDMQCFREHFPHAEAFRRSDSDCFSGSFFAVNHSELETSLMIMMMTMMMIMTMRGLFKLPAGLQNIEVRKSLYRRSWFGAGSQ